MLVALHGILKAHFQDAFNLRTGIHIGVVGLVVVLILLAEIHTARQFANADEVRTVHQFRTERRLVQEALEGLHRADIGKQPQLLAHSQQSLFGTHLGGGVIVEFRVAYCRKEHCIGILTSLIGSFGERVAHFVDGVRTAHGILITYFVTEFLANGGHYVHTYGGNLRANAVTG